jgi:hypothetical protein
LAADIAAMDKEISIAVAPFEEIVLMEEDNEEEGHYHDHGETIADDPMAQDLLVGAEVHLTRTGDRNDERPVGRIIGRKRKADGTIVRRYHPDQRLDTRQYEVEFSDGTSTIPL